MRTAHGESEQMDVEGAGGGDGGAAGDATAARRSANIMVMDPGAITPFAAWIYKFVFGDGPFPCAGMPEPTPVGAYFALNAKRWHEVTVAAKAYERLRRRQERAYGLALRAHRGRGVRRYTTMPHLVA